MACNCHQLLLQTSTPGWTFLSPAKSSQILQTLRSGFNANIYQSGNILLLAVKTLLIFVHCSNSIRKLSLSISYTYIILHQHAYCFKKLLELSGCWLSFCSEYKSTKWERVHVEWSRREKNPKADPIQFEKATTVILQDLYFVV